MTRRSSIRATSRNWPTAFCCLFFLPTLSTAVAQRGDIFNNPLSTTSTTTGYNTNGGAPLVLMVSAGKSVHLDRQATVKLFNRTTQTVSWQTTDGRSEASFGGLQFGHYEIEVSAVGYITAHKELEIISQSDTYRLEIVMEADPASVVLRTADDAMPPKARKNTKRGVSALKSGNLNAAERWLDAAYKAVPSNPDLNFLLGYLYFQKKDFARAQTYLGTATEINPHDVQALTLLGRLGLQQGDYAGASTILRKAVDADSDYWMAHHFLADSYLKQREWEKAREQAGLAIDIGKFKANPSQVVLGQALVNLGQEEDGIKALKSFLQEAPKNPAAPEIRNLISELEARTSLQGEHRGNEALSAISLAGVDSLVASPQPTFSVKPWQPPGVDDSLPSVAAGTACPYDTVWENSGVRVKELVDNVSRISAIEHLVHERLDEMGNPITRDTRQFNYVAAVAESMPGSVAVDEYRQEHLGLTDFPDQIASSGFATLALVFHPEMRDNFEMVCEGLGEWRGQATWLVHFRQRDDRPARIHDYKVGNQVYALRLKGRAWITADKFQIVRIESELVSPLPQIRLAGEHQVVEYGPVPFAKRNVQLWLPQSAEIYLDFRKHRYYRKHSFDHYMLFSVDAEEKHKEPKAPAEGQKLPLN